MSYVSSDRDYTKEENSGVNPVADRVGDITGEPATNQPTDRNKASKLANLLEDLEYPASKERILDHLNRRQVSMGNRINDILERIHNNLNDSDSYNSAYEIEIAAGLVNKS